jgi:hypothetical protein
MKDYKYTSHEKRVYPAWLYHFILQALQTRVYIYLKDFTTGKTGPAEEP